MEGSKNTAAYFSHLKELIEEIKIGMLTTTHADGTLRSRPLAST
jgi:general stress protein 26